MDNSKDTFPGHDDAGKALDWISRQISETVLAKDLLSKIPEPGDEPNGL
ncbi:MAG TPA: hypothetical protein VGC62_27505 [Pseudomonas sp.]